MSKMKVYIYTSSAKKFGDKMLQSLYGLISSQIRVIYGVKDSWRLLLITNNRKEWKKLLLVKASNPDYCFKLVMILAGLFPLSYK